MLFQRKAAALLAVFVLLFAGCGGKADESALIEPGTQGTSTVRASRGVVSGGALFVRMDMRVDVECTVGWEVLGEDVTEGQVGLMLETFRMYLQDALDGLTTDEAEHGDLDSFAAGTGTKAAERLTNEQLSVTLEGSLAERAEGP